MNDIERVTLALPKELWEDVKRAVPSGQRSRLVVEALRAELRRRRRLEQLASVHRLQDSLRGKYGEFPSAAGDIETMREERDDERDGMR